MIFCQFLPPGFFGTPSPEFGIIEEGQVAQISGYPWGSWKRTEFKGDLDAVTLVEPVRPGKIVCVGRNYVAHAAELGNEVPKEPLIFLKPPSSITGPDQPIVIPPYSQRVEHEGELALVIGKRCSNISENDDPLSYVLGYTCLNDVTARDIQNNEIQFTRAKGFDTFCPVGPVIQTELNPLDALIETRVNGEVRQSGNTSLMVYPIPFLIRWISRMMTLEPGDLIATGTPAGVGPLLSGDSVEVRIAGIGVLRNPVHARNA